MSRSTPKLDATGKASENEIDSATPGRPKDSGSRQQTHAGQALNSGSPSFDKETTRRTNPDPVPLKPPDTK
jgi:hypothetical protein